MPGSPQQKDKKQWKPTETEGIEFKTEGFLTPQVHRNIKSLIRDPKDPYLHRHQGCIKVLNTEIFSCLPKISPFLANSVTRYSMLLVSITCGCRNHTWGLVGRAKRANKHPKGSLFLWFSPKAGKVLPCTWSCPSLPKCANKINKSFTESEKSPTWKNLFGLQDNNFSIFWVYFKNLREPVQHEPNLSVGKTFVNLNLHFIY